MQISATKVHALTLLALRGGESVKLPGRKHYVIYSNCHKSCVFSTGQIDNKLLYVLKLYLFIVFHIIIVIFSSSKMNLTVFK